MVQDRGMVTMEHLFACAVSNGNICSDVTPNHPVFDILYRFSYLLSV